LLVAVMATVAATFSYLKFEDYTQEIGIAQKPEASQQSSTSDSLIANYVLAEKQMLKNVIAVADSILSFPQWSAIYSLGVEKREDFASKALFLRNKSMNFYRQIRSLPVPNEKKQSYDSLLEVADNLRLAGYEIHYQFSLESDAVGESIAKAREYANQVKSAVSIIMNKEQE
ncbi:MAG: hypothetical protein FWC26_04275, partial [Fibromonadales bacterium]|nr:hypothetical protein [Fibromonadales bacterium]